jgi:hypothetical protein
MDIETGLRIETGRYGSNRIDINLRTCQLCNSVDIKDEYHFVLICPCYNWDVRTKDGPNISVD